LFQYKQKGLFKFASKDDSSLIQEIAGNIHNLTLYKLHAVKVSRFQLLLLVH
jgi:hypothetical protein